MQLRYQLLLLACLPVSFLVGQAGTLDPTFNGVGYVSTSASFNIDGARAIAIQPDGKILVAGEAVVTVNSDFAVLRYNADGTLDQTFGTGGIATTPVLNIHDRARAMALRPTGEIILAGESTTTSTDEVALAQFTSNGVLDPTFGNAGIASFDLGSNDVVHAAALQPDGKLVCVGVSAPNNMLARFLPDGTLDPTFNGTGALVDPLPGSTGGTHRDVALQADGKIVAVGQAVIGGSSTWVVVRYNTDGSLDTGFGTGGVVTTEFGPQTFWPEAAMAVDLYADGRIMVAGHADYNTTYAFARYLSDGTLDTQFGNGGTTTLDISQNADIPEDVLLQPDGSILVCGTSIIGSTSRQVVARLLDNGDPDLSWDGVGYTALIVNNGLSGAEMALQSDLKLVVTGGTTVPGGVSDFFTARYETSGTNAIADLNGGSCSLYPQPANDLLWIELDDRASGAMALRLFDARGRMVRSNTTTGSAPMVLAVGDLPAGVYALQLSGLDNPLLHREMVIIGR